MYAEDLSTNGSFWRYERDHQWCELRIGRGNATLLGDGDQIRLCDGSCYAFHAFKGDTPVQSIHKISHAKKEEIEVGHKPTHETSRI